MRRETVRRVPTQDRGWLAGLGQRLSLEKDNQLVLNLSNSSQVLTLTPLQGMPLRRLILEYPQFVT